MKNLIKGHLTKILGRDRVFASVREVSEKFKIPKQTIYSWIYTKTLQTAKRINGHWKIAEDEIEKLKR